MQSEIEAKASKSDLHLHKQMIDRKMEKDALTNEIDRIDKFVEKIRQTQSSVEMDVVNNKKECQRLD